MKPTSECFSDEVGMVARSLVTMKRTIPVRCANLSHEPMTIYPGMNIATVSPVTVIDSDREKKQRYENQVEIPSHLQDLYVRSTNGMTCSQKKAIAGLLAKHKTVFSTSETDLGRTGIIKHSIPT